MTCMAGEPYAGRSHILKALEKADISSYAARSMKSQTLPSEFAVSVAVEVAAHLPTVRQKEK